MNNNHLRPTLAVKVFLIGFLSIGKAYKPVIAQDWQVLNFNSTRKTGNTYELRVEVQTTSGNLRKTLRDQSDITNIVSAYVYKGRVIVLGDAGNVESVDIVDLSSGKRVDTFDCYQPQSVHANWLIYVEYYPNHTFGTNPSDVVLLYNIDKSPEQNRIEKTAHSPTQVGMPIYPQRNVLDSTYNTFVDNQSDQIFILGGPGFLLLSSDRLVFLVGHGFDFPHMRNELAVVDLSSGLPQAGKILNVQIPFGQLHRPGYNPNFLQASSMREISPFRVEIIIPAQEYGIRNERFTSIIMDVPVR